MKLSEGWCVVLSYLCVVIGNVCVECCVQSYRTDTAVTAGSITV